MSALYFHFIPVLTLTITSAYFFSSRLLDSDVPINAPKKPAGIEMMAEFVKGNIAVPVKIAIPGSGLSTLGLIATNTNAVNNPVII